MEWFTYYWKGEKSVMFIFGTYIPIIIGFLFFYILLPCVSVGFDEQPYCVQFDIDLEKCFLSLFIIEPTNRHYIKIHGDVSHSQILHCEVLDHLQNFKNLFGK